MALDCGTVKLIMDRLQAINQQIAAEIVSDGVAAAVQTPRYFPQNRDSADMPMIIAIPGNATHDNSKFGREGISTLRNYTIVLYVRNFMSGIPTESTQTQAEKLMDYIWSGYWNRPRLETSSGDNDPLAGVLERAQITSDTGIVQETDNIAAVRYTLQVETTHYIQEL